MKQITQNPETASADDTSDARSSVGTFARVLSRSCRVFLVPSRNVTREEGAGGSVVKVVWSEPNLERLLFFIESDMIRAITLGCSVLTVA